MKLTTYLVLWSFLLVLTPARADELTREQWRTLLTKKVEGTLNVHYLFLAKNYNDAALMLSRHLQLNAILMANAHAQVLALRPRLVGPTAAKALRDLFLLRAEVKALSQDTEFHGGMWENLRALRLEECGTEKKNAFTADFSLSAAAAVTALLAQMKEQLDEIVKNGAGDSVGFNVTYSSQSTHRPDGGGHYAGFNVGFDGKGSDMAQAMEIGSGVGAAAGSLICPGIGTAIGAVVGAIVGGILGEIFGETAMAKWTRIFREQSDFINGAVRDLEARGAADLVTASCETFVHRPVLASLYVQIDTDIREVRKEISGLQDAFGQEYEAVEEGNRTRLEAMTDEVFPLVRENLDRSFEKYFARVEALSDESRQFVRNSVTNPLATLLKPKNEGEAVDAEEALWDAVITGDLKYARPTSDGDPELIYWLPAVKAIRKSLRGGAR